MTRQGNRIILGKRDCFMCGGRGTTAAYRTCKKCGGNGRGPKGGRGGCRPCLGTGRAYDESVQEACGVCEGKPLAAAGGGVPETWNDYLPDDVFPSLPFKVYRNCRHTAGEVLMGMGQWCVLYCGDYGAANRVSDADLIEDVRTNTRGVQANNLCDAAGDLPDHVGIFVGPSGYSVKAVRAAAAAAPAEV